MAAKIIPSPGITANDNSGATFVPPSHSFEVAYHIALIAKAERDLLEAKAMLALWEGDKPTLQAMIPDRDKAWEKVLIALYSMAAIPASDMRQVAMKKTAIGKVWMTIEGDLFDCMRHNITSDEIRLKRRTA